MTTTLSLNSDRAELSVASGSTSLTVPPSAELIFPDPHLFPAPDLFPRVDVATQNTSLSVKGYTATLGLDG